MGMLDDPSLVRLLSLVYERRGFDFTQYKEGTLKRRIESRLRAFGLSSYEDYIKILEEKPEEMDVLVNNLSINVTDFFRNPESFEAISKIVIPRVILSKKERQHKIIKAWSCGCSSGDEPYSLAMLLLEKLGKAKDSFTLNIVGTDIDRAILKEAQTMVYSKARLKAVDNKFVDRYFEKIDEDHFRLNEEVGKYVQFKHHDIIKDSPITHCDIILCRNLLIYFNRELQEEVLLKFYECLEPGGFLVLGMVESLVGTAINRFEIIDNCLRIYRRPDWLSKKEQSGPILSQEEIDNIVKEMLR